MDDEYVICMYFISKRMKYSVTVNVFNLLMQCDLSS